MQDTTFGHGIAGIDRQVQDCEFELVRVDPSWCEIGFCIDRKPDPGTQRTTQQIFNADNKPVEVDGSRVEPLLACKGKQALDQRPSPLGGLQRTLKQRQGGWIVTRPSDRQRSDYRSPPSKDC